MKNKKLIIVGLGETAELAYEYFTHDSGYEVVCFAADKEYIKENSLNNLPVVAIEDLAAKYPVEKYETFVAIASSELNYQRTRMYNNIKSMGYKCASYISSKAFVWHNAKIGENCFIFEDNTIQPFTSIGNNVTMWSGNHLGHRSIIKDNCFITSHVVIAGYSEIGENCFLGINSTIGDYVKIGKDNFIGMGAIISKSTADNSFYASKTAELSKMPAKRFCKVKE